MCVVLVLVHTFPHQKANRFTEYFMKDFLILFSLNTEKLSLLLIIICNATTMFIIIEVFLALVIFLCIRFVTCACLEELYNIEGVINLCNTCFIERLG